MGGEATPPCRCSRKPCSVFKRCRRRCDQRSRAVCCPESDEVLLGVVFMGAVSARGTTGSSPESDDDLMNSGAHRGEGEACACSSNTGLARSSVAAARAGLSSRCTTVEERPRPGEEEPRESSKKEKLGSSAAAEGTGRMATERRSVQSTDGSFSKRRGDGVG